MMPIGDQTSRLNIACDALIRMHIAGHDESQVELNLADSGGFVIGRSDSKSAYKPDIDLCTFQALEHGISRRHAALIRYQGMAYILDLSSVNGTLLNGERLTPEIPYALHWDDRVLLGSLSLTIEMAPPQR